MTWTLVDGWIIYADGTRLKAISGGYGLDLAAYAIIASVAATAISAAGTAYSASQSRAAANYNAKVAQQEADTAKAAGVAAADQQRQRYRQILAANRAVVGASGVEEAGSPTQVAVSNTQQAELNALWTEYEGETRSYGLRTESELQRMRAQNAMTTGLINTGGTLLSGGYNLYRTYPSSTGARAQGYDPGNANLAF